MKKFEWIDHPSDIGFKAYGRNLEEAFENAALALSHILVDVKGVQPDIELEIKVEAEDKKALLYDWLEYILYQFSAEGVITSEFKVSKILEKDNEYELIAKARGEKLDLNNHKVRTEVKAITYHMMEINYEKDYCTLQVIVDI